MDQYSAPGIAGKFTDFAINLKYEDLAPEVVAAAKNGVLDFIGVTLVGSKEESSTIMRAACAAADQRGKATLLGTRATASLTAAALANGYASHALDYDDVQPLVGTHLSGAMLAALLPLAESLHLSGKALINAYVAGFEVGGRLGAVRRWGYYLRDHGVHPTGFVCHFAAFAAAARLLELDALQMRRGFGIVAGSASGLMRSFGTMCKGQNAGNAAQNALFAAQLAKGGFTGPEEVFNGEANVFTLHGGETDPEELFRNLGTGFLITDNTFKGFACAGWRNPIMESMIAIASDHKLKPADVAKIDLRICHQVSGLPNYTQPKTGLEAKFSAQYAAAVAFADKGGSVAQFSNQRVTDPVLIELGQKVSLETDPSLELNQIRATVRTNDGREFSHFIEIPKGNPRNPFNWNDLEKKFRSNAREVLGARSVNKLVASIRDLDGVADVAELTRLCRPGR